MDSTLPSKNRFTPKVEKLTGKVCSISFEPHQYRPLFRLPRLPDFSWSMDYFSTIHTEWIYLRVELDNLMDTLTFDFQSQQ